MPTFSGSFQIEGDSTSLPATLSVDGATIRLNSRSHLIGEWPVSEIGLHEIDDTVVMTVEGERVHLDLRDRSGFMSATGLMMPPPKSRVGRTSRRGPTAGTTRFERSAEERIAGRRSIKGRIGGLFTGLRPDLTEIEDRARSLRWGKPMWAALMAFVAAVIFVPAVVVVSLTIVGTLATLVATFAYVDDSLRVRFPNRLSPAVLLAAGLGILLVAILVATIR